MEIESKKTVLNDEASIYQKRKNEYTKEDFKNMSSQDKLSYFKEYYLKIVIIGLVIVIAAGVLIKDIFFDHSQSVLYVSCVNECQIDATDELSTNLKDYIKPENEKDFVTAVNYDLNNTQLNMSFVTLLNAGTLDLIVCPYDYYVEAAGAGYFVDLSDFLPANTYAALSDKILMTGLIEWDSDGNVISTGEPQAFGIDISDNEYFSGCTENTDKVVLCVVNGTLQEENALKGIEYLTEK